MTRTKLPVGGTPGAGTSVSRIIRLWRDANRVEQRARLGGLTIQTCDEAAKVVWETASAICAQLPQGVRIDLPSRRVFARVLGVYRSAGSLVKRPILTLELSVQEIANLAGYSKSVVEAALRWLGSEPITYFGLQIAHGLRYIDRRRRKAHAYLKGNATQIARNPLVCGRFLG